MQLAGKLATVIDARTLTVSGMTAQNAIAILSRAQVPLDEVTVQKASLEDVYFQLTSEDTEFRAGSNKEADK